MMAVIPSTRTRSPLSSAPPDPGAEDRAPHTVGAHQALIAAHSSLRSLRHVPVLRGGTLLGILPEPDLDGVESMRDVDPAQGRVEDAITSDVMLGGASLIVGA
jgi:hypothetical protein